MASNRYLWRESFKLDDAPRLPCPRCKDGQVFVERNTISSSTVADSLEYFEENGADPEFDYQRFVLLMTCNNGKCRETVAVAGTTKFQETRSWMGDLSYDTFFEPQTMIPGPALMVIPDGTPSKAAEAMRQAFTAFWGDRGAAANRLRISVERIMDAENIDPTKKLYQRIDDFGIAHPDLTDTLDALRHVGNLGSHDGDVGREELLAAFEIYQEWLRDYYGRYKDRIAAMTAELVANKGKLTSRF
ncbi:DUF4145 domain-containing protein [Rhizobium ruizarguesonis]|uniref:DUF4145 domain-containing protein n=1 Tax=Rhizobium ruizarguesonis TaxID=2081791 RepID=UPI0013BD3434|nr:DUF4145 domain-containing protein [Rhizobium ruizarguesonis]NEH37416.1 DUF4145 domain-containing protein [Rhizobium ruizarguesonis]NKL12277.1 DUF4145 domain-containing protein [Rhizobium leguminosarum bv. viciae]